MNSPDANFINREDKIVESSFEMKDYINKFYQLMMILFGRKPTIAPLTLRDAETKENDILVKRTEEINQLVEEINDLVEKYSEENDLKKKEIWEDKFLEKAKEAIELIYLGDKLRKSGGDYFVDFYNRLKKIRRKDTDKKAK